MFYGFSCGFRTVSPGDQANFICPKSPSLRVNVDTNTGDPAANVLILVDGNVHGMTNLFGTSLRYTTTGPHVVQIVYKFDENGPIYGQEQNVNVTGLLETTHFTASVENGTPLELATTDTNTILVAQLLSPIFPPLRGFEALAPFEEFCQCQRPFFEEEEMTVFECTNLLYTCVNGLRACSQRVQLTSFHDDYCHEENEKIAALVNDAIFAGAFELAMPLVIVPVAGKAIPPITKFIKTTPLAEPVAQATKISQNAWETTGGRAYNYLLEHIPGTGKYIPRIKTFSNKTFSKETTEMIEITLKKGGLEGRAGIRTVRIMEVSGELPVSNGTALKNSVRDLLVDNWNEDQIGLLHKYIGKSPEAQGDSIMVAMYKSGEFTDDFIHQALELDNAGEFKNIKFGQLIGGGPKDADNLITVGTQNFWIDSTSIQEKLISEQNLYGKLLSDSRRLKFESLPSQDGIQIIKLDIGTTLTPQQILGVLEEALPQMPGTAKLKVYDSVTGRVIFTP